MTENPEFDLEPSWLIPTDSHEPGEGPAVEETPAEPAHTAEPVVVIQYRNRGISPVLLLPITLVATLGLLAGYHTYFGPPSATIAPTPSPETPTPPASANPEVAAAAAFSWRESPLPLPLTLEGRPVTVESSPVASAVVPVEPKPVTEPKPAPEPAPVAVVPEPDPDPTPKPEEKPERISIASASPVLAKPDAAAVDPAVDVASVQDAPPAVAPLPTQEEMMERIRQEAEIKAFQRSEQERREQEGLEQLRADESNRLETERADFRRALRDILKDGSAGAGPAIEALCDQYGRVYNEGVRQRAYAILARNKGRITSDVEVRILRSLGVPEPAVLDFLCNRLNRSLHSRNGPHDSDEVRVAAARQLLRIPATATRAADPAVAAPASPARSPVYRRSSP